MNSNIMTSIDDRMTDKVLDEKTIYGFFDEFGTPAHVIAHCEGVRRVAVRIGEELNSKGLHLDMELIDGASLVHDLARAGKDHQNVCAAFLKEKGYEDAAYIVSQHMTYVFPTEGEPTECDIVCLADRLVREDQYVGLEKRIDYLIHKKTMPAEVLERLQEAKLNIRAFADRVETILGRSIDSLFPPPMDHILKRVEKPGRYIGGEINMVEKDPSKVDVRFGFAFPDTYEIGMSYTGLQILYDSVNSMDDMYLERIFAPASDMEGLMRKYEFPLFTLETGSDVKDMDVLGFTLQYEMSFTNVLNMLELAGMPLRSKDRGEESPLVVAGGPCAFNPEPLAEFIDVFLIGDGELQLPGFLKRYGSLKREGKTREEILEDLSSIQGVYVPSFYEPMYDEFHIKEYRKTCEKAPERVLKGIVDDIDAVKFPVNNIVPLIECVHERAVMEIFRGCTRGCRFCQAGMIYRPIRERKVENLIEICKRQLDNTGHDELSVLSLSTSDYSDFEELATCLTDYCTGRDVSLSLPSLRMDTFSFKVLDKIQGYRKTGLTFAPEAGTQRLRDVINKGITEDDIYSAVEQAIDLGWRHVKLYFMIGLPGETYEDLDGIADIARNITQIHKKSGKGGRFNVSVSISNFVPKPHTPFQWVPQDTPEEMRKKHDYLAERLKIKGVTFGYHDDMVSRCEAVIARGDRRTGELLEIAHELGCTFDAWSENFDPEKWNKALEMWSMDEKFYTERERDRDEFLPWNIVDSGIKDDYLWNEYQKSRKAQVTPDCRQGCTGCGINRYTECRKGGSNA